MLHISQERGTAVLKASVKFIYQLMEKSYTVQCTPFPKLEKISTFTFILIFSVLQYTENIENIINYQMNSYINKMAASEHMPKWYYLIIKIKKKILLQTCCVFFFLDGEIFWFYFFSLLPKYFKYFINLHIKKCWPWVLCISWHSHCTQMPNTGVTWYTGTVHTSN